MGALPPIFSSVAVATVPATCESLVQVWTPATFTVLWDVAPPPARPSGYRPVIPFQRLRLSSFAISAEPNFGNRSHNDTPYPARSLASTRLGYYGDDFYDRVHYQFIDLNLGNLLGVQERTLWVWNAYRRTRTLEAISFAAFDGINFTGTTPPTLYGALELREYNVSVSLDGPSVIAAQVLFDWDEGQSQIVNISGQRVITWSWIPDWQRPVVERLEWRTDVLTSYRGEEQRRALRRAPRRYAEFYTGDVGRSRRVMETALFGWGARIWALPLWWDGCETTAPVAAGSTIVYVPAETRDFQVGETAVFYYDWETFENCEIAAVYADRVVLQRPALRAWPEGTRFYPARTARIDGSVDLERWDGLAAFHRMRWIFEGGANYVAQNNMPTHNNYPVLEIAPNWADQPSLAYDRKLAIFDAGVGLRAVEDEALMAFTTQRQRFTFVSRAEIKTWREILYSLRGKQGAIYVPTWTQDFTVVSLITSNATAIDVQKTEHTSLIGQIASRRDIRIKLFSGQIFYRRITGSVEINQTTERLNINAALGLQVQPENVDTVSYMSLCRFDSDAVDLAWWQGDVCESQISLRTFNHGV